MTDPHSKQVPGMATAEYDTRKAFLQLTQQDAVALAELGKRLITLKTFFVERFYDHLLKFDEPRSMLSDPGRLSHLKQTQAEYFAKLFAGDYGPAYCEDRQRIGVVHQRIGLDPKWYLGAYALYLRTLMPEIGKVAQGDWSQALAYCDSAVKVIFLDMGIAIDTYIAADKRQMANLKEFYERIVASVPAGLLVVDSRLKVLSANRSYLEQCGCDREAIVGRAVADVLGVQDIEAHVREALGGAPAKVGLNMTVRCAHGDTTRPVRVAVTGIRLAEEEEEEEEERRALIVVEDVSKEERLAQLAAAMERRYHEVVENANDGIVIMGQDGKISYFNRAAEKMFGYERSRMIGQPVTVLMPQQYRERHQRGVARYLETGQPRVMGNTVSIEGLREDASIFPMEGSFSAYRVGAEVVFTAILRDTTERRRAEEHIRLQSAALEAVADPVCITDREGVILAVNNAFCRQNGWQAEEAVGKKPRILKSGHTDKSVYPGMWRTILGGGTWTGEVVNRKRGGEDYIAELTIAPVRGAGGSISHFVSTHRDISERRRTDDALRLIVEGTAPATGTEFFRSLVRHLSLALGTKYAMITRLADSPPKHVQTVAFWAGGSFAENLDIPLAGTPCEKVLAGDFCFHPKDVIGRFPKCRDLAYDAQSYMGIPLFNSEGKVIGHLAVLDDKPMREIDERRARVLRIFGARAGAELDRTMAGDALAERETQLRQAQKMEAVGRLAGGIAHDFNNLLTAILGCSTFLLQNLKPDDSNRADVLEIEAAGNRAATLTKQLLAFSRKQMLQPKRMDLNVVVKEVQSMLKRLIGEDIELLILPSGKPLIVKVDRGQTEQVIMNLAINARDAMPNTGKIIIETAPIEFDEAHVHRHGKIQPGSYVMLAVSDTGCGMSEAVQAHLFEPFFTTKEKGKGTGLGLSTVYGIVAQSDGYITAYSEAGRGTTFKIYLPRLQGRAENDESTAAQVEPPRGSGVVLLVEDETSVRELVRRVLTLNGFTVVATGDPLEALDLCERQKEPIQLLVTDMVMPNLNGLEVARKVRAARPGIRVLYMSGYTEHAVLQQGIEELEGAFLMKPFMPRVLLEKVHEILGTRS